MGCVIVAAADGSSLANPGPSGWAWYIDDLHWAAGGWAKGTNNMGELMSVLDLLRSTSHTDEPLKVLCDSQYAINCCTRWIPAWKKRGWRKADNKPVLNLDLMKQLDEELKGRRVTFQWVKGHSGHPLNEKADELARAAATAYQQGTPVHCGPGFSSAQPVREPDTVPPPEDGLSDSAPGSTSPGDPSLPGLSQEDGLRVSEPRDRARSLAEENGEASWAMENKPDTSTNNRQLSTRSPVRSEGAQTCETPTSNIADNDALIPLPPDPITRPQPDLLSIAHDQSHHRQPGETHSDGTSVSAPALPTTSSDPPKTQEPSTSTTRPRPTPNPSTVVDITELTRELMSDETQLDRDRLDELMHPEFVAHLPAGLIRTKGSILARPAELSGSVQLDVLGADRLSDDALLLRYRLRRNSQDFLCAILWQRGQYGWQARFQQMTTVVAG